jgi:hypothetical protein
LLELEGGTFAFDTLDAGVIDFLAEALGDDSLLGFFAGFGDDSLLAAFADPGDDSLLGIFADFGDFGDDSLFGVFGVDGAFWGVSNAAEDKEALTFVPMTFFGCGDVNLFLLRIFRRLCRSSSIRDLLDAPVAVDLMLDTEESSSSFSTLVFFDVNEELLDEGLDCPDPLSSRTSLSSSSFFSVRL